LGRTFYEDRAVIGSSIELPRTKLALSFAKGLRVNRALDLGCGDGQGSIALGAVTGAKIVCADTSGLAVQACAEKGLEAHKVSVGEELLPFDKASFDLVLMTEVLEHLVNPDYAMDEVRRVLRPDGHLILSTPNLACLPNRVLLAVGIQPLFSEVGDSEVLGRRFSVLGQGGHPVGHLRLYTKRALLEYLASRGFNPIRVKGAAFHEAGILHSVERFVATAASLAMILVVLARPKFSGVEEGS
jgi:2-polyprenyl-3-methyl-5-hydroxy-6-metoxy-1,4-benzoquinol methylase